MRITLHPTEEVVQVDDGTEARVWVGMSDGNIPVRALVVGISPQTSDPLALAVFERELQERQELLPAATAALNPLNHFFDRNG